jgi:hypothetical protein
MSTLTEFTRKVPNERLFTNRSRNENDILILLMLLYNGIKKSCFFQGKESGKKVITFISFLSSLDKFGKDYKVIPSIVVLLMEDVSQ